MLSLSTKYIDFDRTKSVVLKYIDEYNFLLALKPTRNEPSVTQGFSFIPPATDRTLNTIESAADKNLKRQALMQKRERVMDEFTKVIETLPATYRYIIVKIYLNRCSDTEVYLDLNISKTNYYKVKKEAIVQLAIYLGIEVYKD
ncbi:phage transcriptional regulator, ArpU family [Jeotgalicoccus aerolatus]|uniref:Phage transcriptional regulator, ArpU family n=1 Tax=Jeotgalicoccus aerolatus TaxID=709510 RepID=A0A1G9BT26_9STAP|nr:ArpU family phage packaging/lysis transcriptional regulator [Jeotgalicoccus aerolatus]SDK42609.1 phage transcriptional regulator, ArpU family [Jeotgalicoccus aerolatus]